MLESIGFNADGSEIGVLDRVEVDNKLGPYKNDNGLNDLKRANDSESDKEANKP